MANIAYNSRGSNRRLKALRAPSFDQFARIEAGVESSHAATEGMRKSVPSVHNTASERRDDMRAQGVATRRPPRQPSRLEYLLGRESNRNQAMPPLRIERGEQSGKIES